MHLDARATWTFTQSCLVTFGTFGTFVLQNIESSTMEISKVLQYTNKCIETDFWIHYLFWQKNYFSIKMGDPKSGKIAPLHYKISMALRWRARRPGDFESTSVCKQVYRGGFLKSCLVLQKNIFLCLFWLGWIKGSLRGWLAIRWSKIDVVILNGLWP